jgi:hypothetical protein
MLDDLAAIAATAAVEAACAGAGEPGRSGRRVLLGLAVGVLAGGVAFWLLFPGGAAWFAAAAGPLLGLLAVALASPATASPRRSPRRAAARRGQPLRENRA